MSETGDVPAPPQTEAEFFRDERDATLPFDPELVRLVGFINILDTAEIGLTLHVDGCIVSGLLISMAQFFRLLIKDFTDPNRLSEQSNRDAAAGFAEFYRHPLEGAEKLLEEYRAAEKIPPTPRHIHLRYAQTFFSGQEPYTQPLWRGRLTEIDGWSIGNSGVIPPLDQPHQG